MIEIIHIPTFGIFCVKKTTQNCENVKGVGGENGQNSAFIDELPNKNLKVKPGSKSPIKVATPMGIGRGI